MSSKVPVKSFSLQITPEQPVREAVHSRGTFNLPGEFAQVVADNFITKTATGVREQQGRAIGCIALELANQRTLSTGIPAFAEQFPKAFRWTPETFKFDLWAGEGGVFDWIEGVGKTHHVLCTARWETREPDFVRYC